ncbi:MAG: beta-galactosidase, partial [Clostridia bacterium]|nr:beta-galactosidase [Clostridia bacterium]
DVYKRQDIYSLSFVKLGSGNNLIGYYMYHGGTNKIGKLSTFNESKATGYPNDYPILSYDFQAPLSEYGEVREQYRLLNLLHMFVQDFGDVLAPMEAVDSEEDVAVNDLKSLRYCMRTDGESGFVFINHYQRLAKLEDVDEVVIDTGLVKFPQIDVCGDVSFFMPFNMKVGENILEYATVQPLCCVDDTYFFAAVENIEPQYKFADGTEVSPKAGIDSVFKVGDAKIVTLTWEQALYARKLSGKLYIGRSCDVYEVDGKICAACDGDYSYIYWNGTGFEEVCVKKEFKNAKAIFENILSEPFSPMYSEELNIGGKRKTIWQRITVDSDQGFIEINYSGDAAQIYADGNLIADGYYYGLPWRVPARLLYGKTCYLAVSEMKDDFYREF